MSAPLPQPTGPQPTGPQPSARRSWARWTVPAALATLAVGGGGLANLLPAIAEQPLPPRTAAALLVDIQNARLDGLSGTVVQRADLGLPQLPLPGGQGSSDLASLISGTHTLRLWYAGPEKVRVALLGTLGESDVIRDGADLWTWSSSGNSATHRRLTAPRAAADPRETALAATGLTPQQAAERALAAIDPTTVVTTAGTATVAGLSAYELVLAPRDVDSLIGQVRIAIEAVHRVPVRVQVFAKAADTAAVQVAFTQVSFSRPAESQFRFTPPPGVTVTEQASAGHNDGKSPKADPGQSLADPGQSLAGTGLPRVLGTGWTSVVAARMPADAPGGPSSGGSAGGRQRSAPSLDRVLGALPEVTGSWGAGRLLSSRLFSVLLIDDGRVYAGAVSPARLYQAAAQPLAPAATGR